MLNRLVGWLHHCFLVAVFLCHRFDSQGLTACFLFLLLQHGCTTLGFLGLQAPFFIAACLFYEFLASLRLCDGALLQTLHYFGDVGRACPVGQTFIPYEGVGCKACIDQLLCAERACMAVFNYNPVFHREVRSRGKSEARGEKSEAKLRITKN